MVGGNSTALALRRCKTSRPWPIRLTTQTLGEEAPLVCEGAAVCNFTSSRIDQDIMFVRSVVSLGGGLCRGEVSPRHTKIIKSTIANVTSGPKNSEGNLWRIIVRKGSRPITFHFGIGPNSGKTGTGKVNTKR